MFPVISLQLDLALRTPGHLPSGCVFITANSWITVDASHPPLHVTPLSIQAKRNYFPTFLETTTELDTTRFPWQNEDKGPPTSPPAPRFFARLYHQAYIAVAKRAWGLSEHEDMSDKRTHGFDLGRNLLDGIRWTREVGKHQSAWLLLLGTSSQTSFLRGVGIAHIPETQQAQEQDLPSVMNCLRIILAACEVDEDVASPGIPSVCSVKVDTSEGTSIVNPNYARTQRHGHQELRRESTSYIRPPSAAACQFTSLRQGERCSLLQLEGVS
ncbi:hypothetical protein C8Q75DRAFT_730679 [Abortiporus biennis]|nr:hypothetical protein C8Q75DRAFT_730679 [Abortiporus biennis]